MKKTTKNSKKDKRTSLKRKVIIIISEIVLLLVIVAGIYIFENVIRMSNKKNGIGQAAENDKLAVDTILSESETETEKNNETQIRELLESAEKLAQTYDYKGAIKILKSSSLYDSEEALKNRATEYRKQKDSCVEIKPEEVTHIFYHSLVVDPERAFIPGEVGYDGWQQWMTTVDEFDKVTQSMYEKGYVLVGIHDLVEKTVDDAGNIRLEPKSIYLPEGKKAFVLSVDDLSYYHTYDNHGVASKIVLDKNGKTTCEYIDKDGKTVYGDYDVVPRLNRFLEEHPDGCYKGARGTIALTGYNGVLGYRTDGTYSEEHKEMTEYYYMDELQKKWLKEHPDYQWEREVENAKKVADAIKAEGWTFASHTWGHKNISETSYEELVMDTERWSKYVGSIVGETDTIIFAHGADITATGVYTKGDPKYDYLRSKGFYFFCNVDSGQYTTTVTQDYFHQGRRNIDGYRIYKDSQVPTGQEATADLFDAAKILDPKRPLPVPDL